MKWDDAYTKKQGVIFLQSLTGGTGIGTGGAVRVYIFDRSSNSWYYETELTPSGVVAGDSFGNAVSVSGLSVLVGATGQDTGGSLRGAAYIFNWDPSSNSYYQKAMLQAADTDSGDYFGNSVALDGNFAAIGSYNHDLPASNAGAVYIFGYNSHIFEFLLEIGLFSIGDLGLKLRGKYCSNGVMRGYAAFSSDEYSLEEMHEKYDVHDRLEEIKRNTNRN